MERRRRVVRAKPNKSGCRTCRLRKVKCDQTRPTCMRCLSGDRECVGFPIDGKRADPADGKISTRAIAPALLASPQASSVRRLRHVEQVALDFFIHQDIPSLTHLIPTPGWIQLFIGLVSTDDTVLRTCIALGRTSLQQTRITHHTLSHDLDFVYEEETFRLYCEATTSVATALEKAHHGKMDEESILVCCLLFSIMDIMQDNQRQALSHIKNGISVARTSCRTGNNAARIMMQVFLRLRADSIEPSQGIVICQTAQSRVITSIPIHFVSAEHARDVMDTLDASRKQTYNELYHGAGQNLLERYSQGSPLTSHVRFCAVHSLVRTIPLTLVERLLIQAHEAWLGALLLTEKLSLTTDCCTILRLHHFASLYELRVRASTCLSSSEEQEKEFSSALDQAQQYLSNSPLRRGSSPSTSPQAPSLSMETSILTPLFLVAVKSRNPGIRERAIALLQYANRFEGVHWSTWLASRAGAVWAMERVHDGVADGSEPSSSKTAWPGMLQTGGFLDLVLGMGRPPHETLIVGSRFNADDNPQLEIVEYSCDCDSTPIRPVLVQSLRLEIAHS